MDPRRRFFQRGSLQQATAPQAPRPPRPPWDLADEAAFTARCTRQGCDACGRVCATGDIGPAVGEAFVWRVTAAPRCLALRQVERRVCGDACDTGVLRFRPVPGGIRHLAVDTARCPGCGDCLPPCPVGALVLEAPG